MVFDAPFLNTFLKRSLALPLTRKEEELAEGAEALQRLNDGSIAEEEERLGTFARAGEEVLT